jgi:hypothetical protein
LRDHGYRLHAGHGRNGALVGFFHSNIPKPSVIHSILKTTMRSAPGRSIPITDMFTTCTAPAGPSAFRDCGLFWQCCQFLSYAGQAILSIGKTGYCYTASLIFLSGFPYGLSHKIVDQSDPVDATIQLSSDRNAAGSSSTCFCSSRNMFYIFKTSSSFCFPSTYS